MFFYNLRYVVVRWRRYVAIVIIMAVATGSFLALAGALESFGMMLTTSNEYGNAVLVSRGTYAESFPELGRVPPSVVSALSSIRSIASDERGPLISPEFTYTADINRDGRRARVTVRGVTDRAFAVHQVVVGTMPKDGILIGPSVSAIVPGLHVGDELSFSGRSWKIVGTFSDRDDATQFDSEIWAPLDQLMQARQSKDYGIVYMKAKSPDDVTTLVGDVNAATMTDLQEYRAVFQGSINGGGWTVLTAFRAVHLTFSVLLMGVAGLGTINVLLHNAFRRRRDMALVRALGVGTWQIILGFVGEGAIVAGVGACLGSLLALATTGFPIVTASPQRPGMSVFRLHYRPELLLNAILIGMAVGVFCALLPAWRSSRYRVKDELRAE